MRAGGTTENAEFMLQGDRVETPRVQEAGRADIVLDPVIGDLGLDVFTSTPAELAKLAQDDTARLGKVVRDAGVKAD